MTDNQARTFWALDRAMLEAHREDRDDFAEHTARSLLEYAELPIRIRVRACMILGCSGVAEDALDMAKEAVRIAELGMTLCDDPANPSTTATQLLADARTVLAEVEAAHAKRATESADQEDVGELVREAGSETAKQQEEKKDKSAQ